jgi:crotonobetainyl-CoA:carnitine CoA-transferase CaiB-like acyl-CoA transferase
MTLQPLAGIRVLDFTAFPPGGACTVMLADFGAEIIRIEAPCQKGQPSLVVRQVALSRGKRSMTLDLRNPASSEILQRLAPAIDVVVENARPGAMEARGFGYSHARAKNPPAEAQNAAKVIGDIFRTRPAAEWVERLAPAGAAVTIVNHGIQLLEDPHIRARRSIVESAGVPVPANPVRLSDPDANYSDTVTGAPHTVGQDTADVLASAGFSADEIEDYVRFGLV